jgi:hypothetical protein
MRAHFREQELLLFLFVPPSHLQQVDFSFPPSMENLTMVELRALAIEHSLPLRRSKVDQWEELEKHGVVLNKSLLARSSSRSPKPRKERARPRSPSPPSKRLAAARSVAPKKMPHYTHIIGPISLTEHVLDTYNRHVYCFGDWHVIEPTCKENVKQGRVQIERFITQLVESNPSDVIDVFVESAPPAYELPMDARYADTHILRMTTLLKANAYPNVRLQYVDPRTFTKIGMTLYRLRLEWIAAETFEVMRQVMHDIRNAVANIHVQKELNLIKATKQLEHVKYPVVKRLIQSDFIDPIQRNIARLLPLIDEAIDAFEREPHTVDTQYDSVANYADQAMTPFMDVYALARMFRSYSDNTKAHHVILYVGDNHAKNYRLLFKRLRAPSSTSTYSQDEENKNFQCLDIQEFKQPFFS